MSYEDPDDNDDGPPLVTIPDAPKPGERYMVKEPYADRWGVYERLVEPCDCGAPPHPACVVCGGKGEWLAGEDIACGLSEADARLLAFGGELIKALEPFAAEACADCGACEPTCAFCAAGEALEKVRVKE